MAAKYIPCRQLFKSRTSGKRIIYGTFGSVFDTMSPDVKAHTLKEIDAGGYNTVAEYLSDILIDNYFRGTK